MIVHQINIVTKMCEMRFVAGIFSTNICQRLVENKTQHLLTAFDQARALDTAQRTSETSADRTCNLGLQPTSAELSNNVDLHRNYKKLI